MVARWEQLKDDVRRRWNLLTEDDLGDLHGNLDKLVEVLQRRYGYVRPEAEREINIWRLSLLPGR